MRIGILCSISHHSIWKHHSILFQIIQMHIQFTIIIPFPFSPYALHQCKPNSLHTLCICMLAPIKYKNVDSMMWFHCTFWYVCGWRQSQSGLWLPFIRWMEGSPHWFKSKSKSKSVRISLHNINVNICFVENFSFQMQLEMGMKQFFEKFSIIQFCK